MGAIIKRPILAAVLAAFVAFGGHAQDTFSEDILDEFGILLVDFFDVQETLGHMASFYECSTDYYESDSVVIYSEMSRLEAFFSDIATLFGEYPEVTVAMGEMSPFFESEDRDWVLVYVVHGDPPPLPINRNWLRIRMGGDPFSFMDFTLADFNDNIVRRMYVRNGRM